MTLFFDHHCWLMVVAQLPIIYFTHFVRDQYILSIIWSRYLKGLKQLLPYKDNTEAKSSRMWFLPSANIFTEIFFYRCLFGYFAFRFFRFPTNLLAWNYRLLLIGLCWTFSSYQRSQFNHCVQTDCLNRQGCLRIRCLFQKWESLASFPF